MKKHILLIFISTFLVFQSIAQSITKEEIECIDALILAKTAESKCKAEIDNYTLFNCFNDSSVFKNKKAILNQLELLKTNDILRNQFYGKLNYYYSGQKRILNEKLAVYRDDSTGYTQIVLEQSLNSFIEKITSSIYNHDEEIFKICDTTTDKSISNDTTIEQNAMYPGGDESLINFIKNRLNYPQYEKEADISGKVLVQFVVEKNGMVSCVKCLKKVSPGLDCEAMRVIKLLPRWTPAKNNGKPVRLYFNFPINFTLQ
jgi:protein TonB